MYGKYVNKNTIFRREKKLLLCALHQGVFYLTSKIEKKQQMGSLARGIDLYEVVE